MKEVPPPMLAQQRKCVKKVRCLVAGILPHQQRVMRGTLHNLMAWHLAFVNLMAFVEH